MAADLPPLDLEMTSIRPSYASSTARVSSVEPSLTTMIRSGFLVWANRLSIASAM
jgi:hypothetical protein